jgi:hypothetical protein
MIGAGGFCLWPKKILPVPNLPQLSIILRPPRASLLLGFAPGLHRRYMPVHEGNVLPELRRTWVELVVIQEERRRSRRECQDEVRDTGGRIPLFQQKERVVCARFIDAMPVQLRIPFVTRSFRGEPPLFIRQALEDRRAVRVRAGGAAKITRQHIANARQRILRINRHGRKNLRTRQTLVVIVRVKTRGDRQLPKIVQARCVMSLRLRSAQSRQQQRREDRNNGDHRQQFNETKGATSAGRWVAHIRAAVRFKKVCFHRQSNGSVINEFQVRRLFLSSGAVSFSRELDALFRGEFAKLARLIGRRVHLDTIGRVERLARLRGCSFDRGARARFARRNVVQWPTRSGEPQATRSEQRRNRQEPMFSFHRFDIFRERECAEFWQLASDLERRPGIPVRRGSGRE